MSDAEQQIRWGLDYITKTYGEHITRAYGGPSFWDIPPGCTCSYTWGGVPPRLVRNGALASCTASHPDTRT